MSLRLAVTGASGFIGGAVTRAAVAAGHQVHAFGRRPASALSPGHLDGAAYRSWDITSGHLPDPPEIDAVVHCAGSVTDFGRLSVMRRVNVGGTARVYETFCAEDAVTFVHVSTASVYAPWFPTINAVESAAPPSRLLPDPYGRSKSEAEEYLRAGGRAAIILRPHAVYGPGDTTLLPRLLDAIRPTPRGPRLFAVGDGRQRLSLTGVDNLAQACLLAASASAEHELRGRTFNITDGESVALDEVLRTFLAARGSKAVPVYVPFRAAYAIASATEAAAHLRQRWVREPKPPRLTRYAVRHLAFDRTLAIDAAREALGYRPAPTSLEGSQNW